MSIISVSNVTAAASVREQRVHRQGAPQLYSLGGSTGKCNLTLKWMETMASVINMWIPRAQERPPSSQSVTKKHNKDAVMEDIGWTGI